MKTVLKLVVALVVLNAAVRAADVLWDYYRLKDSAQQLVTFGANVPSEQIRSGIVESAAELGIPLGPEGVTVQRNAGRTVAEASYTQPVELFPNYAYPVTLSFRVNAVALGGNPVN